VRPDPEQGRALLNFVRVLRNSAVNESADRDAGVGSYAVSFGDKETAICEGPPRR